MTKPEITRPLRRVKRRWEVKIRIYLREREGERERERENGTIWTGFIWLRGGNN
jgi:hypothetical protein